MYNCLCNQPDEYLREYFSEETAFNKVFTKVLMEIPQNSDEKYVS